MAERITENNEKSAKEAVEKVPERITGENIEGVISKEKVEDLHENVKKVQRVAKIEAVVEPVKEDTKNPNIFSDAEMSTMIKGARNHMVDILAKQPRYSIFVPKDGIGVSIEVQINGLLMSFPTDQYIDVPQSVAELLKKYVQTLQTGGDSSKVSRNENVQNALN